MWALLVGCFREARKREVSFFELSYEDLLENPEQVLTSLLSHCGLAPGSDLSGPLAALEGDSQAGSVLSRDSVGKAAGRRDSLSAGEEATLDEVLAAAGLPPAERSMENFSAASRAHN